MVAPLLRLLGKLPMVVTLHQSSRNCTLFSFLDCSKMKLGGLLLGVVMVSMLLMVVHQVKGQWVPVKQGQWVKAAEGGQWVQTTEG